MKSLPLSLRIRDRSLQIAAISTACWVGAGCVDSPPFQPFDNDAALRRALSSSSSVLYKESGGNHSANVKILPLLGDNFAAVVNPYQDGTVFDDAVRSVSLVRKSASGTKTALLPAARTVAISIQDEAVILHCRDNTLIALTDPEQGYVLLSPSDTGFSCAGIGGKGFSPDTFLQYDGASIRKGIIDRGAKTVAVSMIPVPDGFTAAGVRFLDEPLEGTPAFVSLVDGSSFVYQRGTTKVSPPAAPDGTSGIPGKLDVLSLWRGADGAFRVVTADGLFRWDPDGANTVTKLAAAPEPLENGPWKGVVGQGFQGVSIQLT
jgi:hypothetical protein